MRFRYRRNRWALTKWTLGVIGMAILFFTVGQGVSAQRAQDPIRLSTLEIALWPEFDEPEVLVIFQGRLADNVSLPAVLTLSMPKGVSEPHAVASVDEDNRRLTAAYELQETEDETLVTYTSLQHRAFQFEYYWDPLQIDGDARTFAFSFTLDFPVDAFNLEFQQPFDATNVALSPPAVETVTGFAGLLYHRRPFGAVEAGRTVTWQVSYDKSSDRLSAETLPTPAPGATPGSASSRTSQMGIFIAVGVAIVALVAGVWFIGNRRLQASSQRYARSRRRGRPSKRSVRRDKGGASPQAQGSKPRVAVEPRQSQTVFPEGGFCHRCGTALASDALFCHRCGTKRKGT